MSMRKLQLLGLIGLPLLATGIIVWALFFHNHPTTKLTPECAERLEALQKEVFAEKIKPVPQPWKRMTEKERREFRMAAMCPVMCSPNPEAAVRSFYDTNISAGRAFQGIIDDIAKTLQNYVNLPRKQALEEAFRTMGLFISMLKTTNKVGLMLGIIEQVTVEGPIILVDLQEAQQYYRDKLPSDIITLGEEILQLQKFMPHWKLFMAHLTAAAAQALYEHGKPEGEVAVEKIVRLIALKDLYFRCIHQDISRREP